MGGGCIYAWFDLISPHLLFESPYLVIRHHTAIGCVVAQSSFIVVNLSFVGRLQLVDFPLLSTEPHLVDMKVSTG